MADEPTQDQKPAEEAVEKAEQAAEVAAETAEETKEAVGEAKEAVEEVKDAVEEKPAPTQSVPAEAAKKPAKPVSKELEKIIEQIEKLSVLELADLVHALEDRFGVSAQAPIALAAGAAPAGAAGEPAEEKTTFNVILQAAGANKISVIKAVRELVPTLGLKEAKDLVEGAPKPVLEGVNKVAAEEAKTKLTAAGGTAELQ